MLVSKQDTIEGVGPEEDGEVPQSYYFIMASQDQLLLNVTPQAMNVLTDINKVSVTDKCKIQIMSKSATTHEAL